MLYFVSLAQWLWLSGFTPATRQGSLETFGGPGLTL